MARLTMSDRRMLAEMYGDEKSALEIANKLGCHPQTIYDELKRGSTGKLDKNHKPEYDPDLAQRTVQENMRRCGTHRRRRTAV